jgi:hypothetical protein
MLESELAGALRRGLLTQTTDLVHARIVMRARPVACSCWQTPKAARMNGPNVPSVSHCVRSPHGLHEDLHRIRERATRALPHRREMETGGCRCFPLLVFVELAAPCVYLWFTYSEDQNAPTRQGDAGVALELQWDADLNSFELER